MIFVLFWSSDKMNLNKKVIVAPANSHPRQMNKLIVLVYLSDFVYAITLLTDNFIAADGRLKDVWLWTPSLQDPIQDSFFDHGPPNPGQPAGRPIDR